ncbi:MAG TPA: hemerythrin domain-containing protein [Flavisolibacter sp.]|nr:hemerythrin domain-containing protein [Flavisolibacter sp.]
MNNPLYQFFTNDHRRIEKLLEKAIADVNDIQMDYYHEFRSGLLKHIKMEEKILFPAAQKANGGIPLPLAAKLRLDHGALTALMVVPPDPGMIKVLCNVLEKHDILEEQSGGMYDLCEKLAVNETQALLDQLIKVTEVPVQLHNKADYALSAAKRALERAGFNYDAIAQ